jgi:hypothetical protein
MMAASVKTIANNRLCSLSGIAAASSPKEAGDALMRADAGDKHR